MDRVGIRDLRNRVSDLVRRARAGERFLITSNGIPVAELGPIGGMAADSIEQLAAAGLLRLPRRGARPTPPHPVEASLSISEVLDELRSR